MSDRFEGTPGASIQTATRPKLDWKVAPDAPVALLPPEALSLQKPKPTSRAEVIRQSANEANELHGKAIVTFLEMLENPATETLSAQYCVTIEAADFQVALEPLLQIKGAEQLVWVAGGNYLRQADKLLIGAKDVLEKGKATLFLFGSARVFRTLTEIEQMLREIQQDMEQATFQIIEQVKDKPQDQQVSIVLRQLEKYMFDERNLENEKQNKAKVLVIGDRNMPGLVQKLKEDQIFPEEWQLEAGDIKNLALQDSGLSNSRGNLSMKIELANSGDWQTDNFFLTLDEIPETVILQVPSIESFSSIGRETPGNHYYYQDLFIDWIRLPYKDRPRVIVYTEGFEPQLYIKHSYQGFLFCSTPDELRNVVLLSNQLAESKANEIYEPTALALKQQEAYDNSDLREWENKTADTYKSLRHVFGVVSRRKLLSEMAKMRYLSPLGNVNTHLTEEVRNITQYESFQSALKEYKKFSHPENPDADLSEKEVKDLFIMSQDLNPWDWEVKTVLDLGTGEGRISISLTENGIKVMGLDISPEQLTRGRMRIKEENEALRGEKVHLGLSYQALIKLRDEGLLPKEMILDDGIIDKSYLTVQGSFFSLQYVLNQALIEWKTRFPNVDPYEFFHESHFNEYAFSDPRDMFADVGFDMAMFNWHTFCEIGSPENQKYVLEQVLNILDRGGELIIEIPDRNIELYASALKKYQAEHPDEPYGTIRDPKPAEFHGLDGDVLYPPRYFPDINELVLLLKSVGFEIDPKTDIQPYLIENTDPISGEKTLTLKEYFVTARKSK